MSQCACGHLSVLAHPTHVARATLRIFTLKEVVNWHCVVTCHRRIILAVPMTLVRHHSILHLDVVKEAGTDCSVASLITQVRVLVHLFGDFHLCAGNFAGAMR